jgi:hypothetical protein
MLEANGKELIGRGSSREHRVGLGHCDGHWLLDEHMRLRPQALDGDRRVEGMRCADDDDVGVCLGEQRAVVGEEGAAGLGGARRAALHGDVRHGGKLCVR